jgi:hypothetical protein
MSGCQRVRVEPEARRGLPFFLLSSFCLFIQSCGWTGERERGERRQKERKRRLTIISGSFQLERNLESKFFFGHSFNIDMPNSTWVGDYRF